MNLRAQPGGLRSLLRAPIASRARWVACVLAAALLPTSIQAQSLDDARRLHGAGDLDAALDAYRAVAAAQRETDPLAAAVALNNSCVIYIDRGDYNAARQTCLDAQGLLEPADDPRLRARNQNNLGVAHQHLGLYEDAERYFNRALRDNRARGDVESQVINLSNLGALGTAAGWYSEAFDAHLAAEALAREYEDEPWATSQLRIAQINQGVVLEKLGEFREALDLYRQVLANADDIHPWYGASLQTNVGVLYRNLGDPVTAVESLENAITAFEELGDTAGLSNAYLNLGLALHLDLDDLPAGEIAYRRALELARESGDKTEEIQDLFYLGRLLVETGRLAEASEVYALCLTAAEESGSAEGRWSALAGLGRVAWEAGDKPDSLDFLRRAMTAVEDVRADLQTDAHRAGFFGDKRPIFAAAVKVLAALEAEDPGAGHAEEALEVVQHAKARQLLDALGSLDRAPDPLSAGELRRHVGQDTLLEYFVAEDTLFLWIVRDDGIRMLDLGPAAEPLAQIATVHDELAGGRPASEQTLSGLANALLRPARTELETATNLRIAADGLLHYLPFELLPVPESTDQRLIDVATVSYLPSGTMLISQGQRRDRAARTLLGFGSPILDPEPDRSLPSTPLMSRVEWPPLPEAERELATAREMLEEPTLPVIGEAATEAEFRLSVAAGARVVHLATHAMAFERPGPGAALLLTPADDDDGLLTAREIANLEYHADLTVLAACRTAIGSAADGFALTTLTGSFLAAGSSAVLATLWDVEDAASATFMEQFYYELGRGAAPATALRRTKLRMRSDPRWDRPSVWAAYVLVGSSGPVVARSLIPLWAWIAAAALSTVAIAAFLLGRRRART